jgi:predicted DNA-binding transcriptional regulator YafY
MTNFNPQSAVTAPRWGQERRLEFIDFRLLWEGRVNRSDLTSHFGISVPQASADLAKYQELSPSNMTYDKQQRTYVALESFRPVVKASNAYSLLNAIRQVDGQMLAKESTFLGWVPPYWIVRSPSRTVDPSVLRRSLHAIRTNTILQILYQSKTRPAPTERQISPHAIAFDGVRWHLRAYCFEHSEFRDFVVSRIISAKTSPDIGEDPSRDLSWTAELTVIVEPAPQLTIGQRRAVELDYGMNNGRIELRVPEAMLLYLLRQLPILSEGSKPSHNPLVLANLSDLQPILKRLQIDI